MLFKNVKRTILDQTAKKDATMRVWTAIKQQGYVIVDVPRVGKEHFVVKVKNVNFYCLFAEQSTLISYGRFSYQ